MVCAPKFYCQPQVLKTNSYEAFLLEKIDPLCRPPCLRSPPSSYRPDTLIEKTTSQRLTSLSDGTYNECAEVACGMRTTSCSLDKTLGRARSSTLSPALVVTLLVTLNPPWPKSEDWKKIFNVMNLDYGTPIHRALSAANSLACIRQAASLKSPVTRAVQ